MLNIVVVDATAAARSRIAEWLQRLFKESSAEQVILPQLNVKQLSRQELKFHSKPDVCIIGDELIAGELTEVASIRKILPDTILLAVTNPQLESVYTIEQLARCGVDDTISSNVGSREFLKKIILLSRKAGAKKNGKLIVVAGGKGGVGVTTVAAGVAEALIESKQKVALVDFDFETQDLSRFLQVRPFINENLQLLFEQARPVTQEFVQQCLVPVWHDEPLLFCMPPIAESEDLFDARAGYVRTLIGILEVLDSSYDCVVVDVGSARGGFLNALYRTADQVVLVMNNDPAALFASLAKIDRIRSYLAPNAELTVVENSVSRSGLPEKLLREEFSRAAKVSPDLWLFSPIPFCRSGSRWPGSGATIYAQGNRKIKQALQALVSRLGIVIESKIRVGSRVAELIDLWALHKDKQLKNGSDVECCDGGRVNGAAVARPQLPAGCGSSALIEGAAFEIEKGEVSPKDPCQEELLPSALVSGVKRC